LSDSAYCQYRYVTLSSFLSYKRKGKERVEHYRKYLIWPH
jgi:hypothetical protein